MKRTGQLGFGEVLLLEGRGRNAALERVAGPVRWEGIETALSGLREEDPGRPGYRPLLLFKAPLLLAWHGLSDAELETALGDRLSFSRFVGPSLENAVPDHTTLCRFRNRLILTGALERLFAELDGRLEAAGLILKRGVMLDATPIEGAAARRRPAKLNEPQQHDPIALANRQAPYRSGPLAGEGNAGLRGRADELGPPPPPRPDRPAGR